MRSFYIILLFVPFFCLTCSQKKNNNAIHQKPDTSCIVPLASMEKKPIFLNRSPIDSDVDSFMTSRTSESFNHLSFRYLKADVMNELLFYAIVAADKFKISRGYYNIAGCITNYFSFFSIGSHSKEIATCYLKKGAEKRDELCINVYESLDKHLKAERQKLWIPEKNIKDSVVAYKTHSLMGNVDNYNKLKNNLIENNQYEQLLYYSYIMADRYDYKPARKDIIDILQGSYDKYGLGEFGEDTRYFCSFFQNEGSDNTQE